MSLSIEFWVKRLSAIGLWVFLTGAAMLTASTVWEIQRFASGGGEVTSAVWIARAILNIADPLIYNGVVLYIAGRIMTAWNVSIVALEQGPDSSLFVKGPDGGHAVWIGRKYKSAAAAQDAAISLRKRFAIKSHTP